MSDAGRSTPRAGWVEPSAWRAPGELRDRITAGEFASDRVRNWRASMELILGDLYTVQLGRSVVERLASIIRGNTALQVPNTFFELQLRWYAISTLVTIERDVQGGRKVVSLLRLLEDIARHPEELTRAKFRRLHTGSGERVSGDPGNDLGAFMDGGMVESRYEEFGGEALDVARIHVDVAELKAAAAPIVALRNTLYAHRSADGPALSSITLGDLHAFVDVLDRVIQKYHALLFFTSMMSTTPIDVTDWDEIFRFAWIPTAERNVTVPYVATPALVLKLFEALTPGERADLIKRMLRA